MSIIPSDNDGVQDDKEDLDEAEVIAEEDEIYTEDED
jgi:hypothetical protein